MIESSSSMQQVITILLIESKINRWVTIFNSEDDDCI